MVSIFIRTAIIYLLLAFSLKIMGKRQIGELEVGELVSTLLISEIVSIAIDTPNIPLLNAIIPMLLIICVEIIVSHVKNKSKRLKKAIEGSPSYIIYEGKLDQGALLQNRISINEILSEMRVQGLSDIKNVKFCILEPDGKISFFEEQNSFLSLPIIIDGELEEENIKRLGINAEWIESVLKCEERKINDVFLMTSDRRLMPNIIYKEENHEK